MEATLKKHGDDALAHNITCGSRAFGLGTKHLKISKVSTEVDFKIFRLLGRLAAKISLNSFVGGVTVMIDPSGGVGLAATSRGGTLNFSFDALEAAGVNHIPGVIPLPGDNSSLGSPGFSAPIVLPLGRMSMSGTIQGF